MEHSLAFDQIKNKGEVDHQPWPIQQGTGFLEIIFLVINFNYEGEGQIIF
jgi:hypothetical protein